MKNLEITNGKLSRQKVPFDTSLDLEGHLNREQSKDVLTMGDRIEDIYNLGEGQYGHK